MSTYFESRKHQRGWTGSSPLEVAEQGAHQLSDAALVGRHHALQTHHQVPAVLGVEHHQLVLPGGHAHSRDLRQRRRSLLLLFIII